MFIFFDSVVFMKNFLKEIIQKSMYKGDNLDTIHYNYYQVENKCELTGNGQMQLLEQTIIRSLKSVTRQMLIL